MLNKLIVVLVALMIASATLNVLATHHDLLLGLVIGFIVAKLK